MHFLFIILWWWGWWHPHPAPVTVWCRPVPNAMVVVPCPPGGVSHA